MGLPLEIRKAWITEVDSTITLSDQLLLSGISKTAHYYEPVPETTENLLYMELIDKEYTAHPFYGSRRMAKILQKAGHIVNRKRVRRLMRLMGLEAIYPKPNLSRASLEDKKYPYLLRGVEILEPDHVWSTDISAPQQAA